MQQYNKPGTRIISQDKPTLSSAFSFANRDHSTALVNNTSNAVTTINAVTTTGGSHVVQQPKTQNVIETGIIRQKPATSAVVVGSRYVYHVGELRNEGAVRLEEHYVHGRGTGVVQSVAMMQQAPMLIQGPAYVSPALVVQQPAVNVSFSKPATGTIVTKSAVQAVEHSAGKNTVAHSNQGTIIRHAIQEQPPQPTTNFNLFSNHLQKTETTAPKTAYIDWRSYFYNLKASYSALEQRFSSLRLENENLQRSAQQSDVQQITAQLYQKIRSYYYQRYRNIQNQAYSSQAIQYSNVVEQLKKENQELISTNMRFEAEFRNVQQYISYKYAMWRKVIIYKDEKIEELENYLDKFNEYLEKDNRGSPHLAVLESYIERLNGEILTKNTEIYKLKSANTEGDKSRELALELKAVKFENDRLTESLMQRSSDLANVRSQYLESEKKLAIYATLEQELESYRIKADSLSEQLTKSYYELNRLKQTANMREGQVAELQSYKDKNRARISTVEYQLDKEREDSRFRISTLENKLAEVERKYKFTEESLRENLKKATDSNKVYSLSDADKTVRIRQLEDEVSQLSRLLEIYKREATSFRRQAYYRIIGLETLKIDTYGKLTQLNMELEQNRKKLSSTREPYDNRNYQIQLVELKHQLDKKNTEIEQKRNEYESGLRKHRQDCEDSYRETLKLYEDKIYELESLLSRKSHKRKTADTKSLRDSQNKRTNEHSVSRHSRQPDIETLRRDNSKLKKLVSEYSYKAEQHDIVCDSLYYLQDRIGYFEGRINQLLNSDQTVSKSVSTVNLRQIVRELNNRLGRFRIYNEQLKNKLARTGYNYQKLKLFEEYNRKLTYGYSIHEQNVQKLLIYVNRLRARSQYYETIIYQSQLQLNQHHIPETSQGIERQKILYEKLYFYKQKNNELESRVNQLIALDADLKRQLEQASKTGSSNNLEFLKQQLQYSYQNVQNLQDQVRKMQEESSSIKTENQARVLQTINEHTTRVSQLEATILELNMRLSTLKNEKNVAYAERSQLLQKVNQYESSLQDVTLKLQSFKREVTGASQDKVRLQQLEVMHNDVNSKFLAVSNEKSLIDGELAHAKKQQLRLEYQLKTATDKLNQANNNNLSLYMTVAQNKSKINQLEQKIDDLTHEINAQQKYKTDADGMANQDRARITKLESRLTDTTLYVYKLEKEKANIESLLKKTQNELSALYNQINKMAADKTNLDSQLSRMQGYRMVWETQITTEKSTIEAQYKIIMSQLESKILSLSSYLNRVQNEKAANDNQHTNYRITMESYYKQLISELESRVTKLTTDIHRIQSENANLESQLTKVASEKGGVYNQSKLIVVQLENQLNYLKEEITRLNSTVSNLNGYISRLRSENTELDNNVMRLESEKNALETSNRLQLSQLYDKLNSFSSSMNMVYLQRNAIEEQSYQDKTKITQLESKLSELTARTSIHQNYKERFISDNYRLKRDLLASRYSYNSADMERNQLRNEVSRIYQIISQLKMENHRLEQTIVQTRSEIGSVNDSTRNEIAKYEAVINELKTYLAKLDQVSQRAIAEAKHYKSYHGRLEQIFNQLKADYGRQYLNLVDVRAYLQEALQKQKSESSRSEQYIAEVRSYTSRLDGQNAQLKSDLSRAELMITQLRGYVSRYEEALSQMRLYIAGAQFSKSEVARYEQIVVQLRADIAAQDQTINQLRMDLNNSLVVSKSDGVKESQMRSELARYEQIVGQLRAAVAFLQQTVTKYVAALNQVEYYGYFIEHWRNTTHYIYTLLNEYNFRGQGEIPRRIFDSITSSYQTIGDAENQFNSIRRIKVELSQPSATPF